MQQENKVLYWFRNDLRVKGNPFLAAALATASELVPVYCFDPRENNGDDFLRMLTLKVINLREQLQFYGSNLLVVYDHYERIIPSLARVLDTQTVYTDTDATPGTHLVKTKTVEVTYLLNMHSITLKRFAGNGNSGIPDIFPCFPKINPGTINIGEESLFRGNDVPHYDPLFPHFSEAMMAR